MMSRTTWVLAVLWLLLNVHSNSQSYSPSSLATVVKQQKPPHEQGTDAQQDGALPTIRTSVDEVNLIFTVTDGRGHFVKGLNQFDFAVLDDGKPPEAIVKF